MIKPKKFERPRRPPTQRVPPPPGTKMWRPPAFVTQFWHPRCGFGGRFRFCKTKKQKNNKRGKSMKQNRKLTISENIFFTIRKRPPKPILVCQNCSSGTKTGLQRRAWGTLATSGAGVFLSFVSQYAWLFESLLILIGQLFIGKQKKV